MSTVATAYTDVTDSCCAKIIQVIEESKSNTQALRPVGTLQAILSDENKGTFTLKLDPNKDIPAADSFRKVYTKDIVPVCNQDTTADAVCATPTFSADTPADNYDFMEHRIGQSIKREIVLKLDDYKEFCLSPMQYLADRLKAFRAGVWQEINTKLNGSLIAIPGAYYDQSGGDNSLNAAKSVAFLTPNSAGGFMFDPTGYSNIKDEYAQLGYPYVNPIIVGGSQLAVFQSNAGFMGGANVNGVTQTGVPNLYVDYGIDTEFADGDNHLVTWAPGALQMISVNDITDDMIRFSVPNQRERMRIESPFGDGFTWDFYFDVDSTGCQFKLKWQLWFDLIIPRPYVTCAPKDILHFIVGCGDNACPDSGYPSGDGGLIE